MILVLREQQGAIRDAAWPPLMILVCHGWPVGRRRAEMEGLDALGERKGGGLGAAILPIVWRCLFSSQEAGCGQKKGKIGIIYDI
jgi:hypothetical protein